MISFLFFGYNLQDSASLVMREYIYFHDMSFYMMLSVSFLVGLLLLFLWMNTFSSVVYLESKVLEIGWTLLPALILVILALPSLKLLFFIEAPTSVSPDCTVKVIGHQWYWSFNCLNQEGSIEKDIYMMNNDDLMGGEFRGLEVDVAIPLPMYTYSRFVTTAADVLHSFALPSLGVKVDAVPGRLNQQCVFTKSLGVYYGQCSEMCGANHSFMPVSVEVFLTKLG